MSRQQFSFARHEADYGPHSLPAPYPSPELGYACVRTPVSNPIYIYLPGSAVGFIYLQLLLLLVIRASTVKKTSLHLPARSNDLLLGCISPTSVTFLCVILALAMCCTLYASLARFIAGQLVSLLTISVPVFCLLGFILSPRMIAPSISTYPPPPVPRDPYREPFELEHGGGGVRFSQIIYPRQPLPAIPGGQDAVETVGGDVTHDPHAPVQPPPAVVAQAFPWISAAMLRHSHRQEVERADMVEGNLIESTVHGSQPLQRPDSMASMSQLTSYRDSVLEPDFFSSSRRN